MSLKVIYKCDRCDGEMEINFVTVKMRFRCAGEEDYFEEGLELHICGVCLAKTHHRHIQFMKDAVKKL